MKKKKDALLLRAAQRTSALAAIVTAVLAGCDARGKDSRQGSEGLEPGGEPWFADATDEVGLDFVHDAGQPGTYFMPEVIGSGAAFLDADGDERLDIYLVQNGANRAGDGSAKNRLFLQGPGGRFTDASAGSGLDIAGRGMGVAVGDVNNDGKPDLLVTEYGGARLFLQVRPAVFADVTRTAGIDNPAWGTAASFFDFDRDGWLDIIIVNYVLFSSTRPCSDQAGRRDYCGPAPFPGTPAKLYRNRGPVAAKSVEPSGARLVTFEDATVRSGIGSLAGPGLGVACVDLNGDHWPDVLVANDGRPNFLWVNQQDGTFQEEAILRGVALNGLGRADADMGIALGDVDSDGLLDIFITHLSDEHHILLKQRPSGYFSDTTGASGLTAARWRSTGFGTLFGDFDLDGDLDLALASGRVKFKDGPSPPGDSYWEVYKERNQLFANDGSGKFQDVSPRNAPVCERPGVWRGLALGDVDGDGDLDLLLTAVADRARLFRNVAPRQGSWLLVRAVDDALGGRDAYGAEITVRAGGRRWVGLVQPSLSYLSSSDPRIHFGLGRVEAVESIEVIWPDGAGEVFGGSTANRVLVLHRGAGTKPGGGPAK